MRLAQFLRHATDDIIAESVAYASQLPPLRGAAADVLRDHLPLVIDAIAADMEQPQSRAQSIAKSLGRGPVLAGETAAQTHGTLRARIGLDIEQLTAEYRVLRSSVLRLWTAAHVPDAQAFEDVLRFNEAVDEAVAESVAFHAAEVERWRHLLLAVLGHDLRSPLNAMLLTTELLQRGGQAPQLATTLMRNARRLMALLDSLLEYNKATLGAGMELRCEEVDLHAACEEELHLLHAAFPAQRMVWTTEGDARGRFDSSRVREAFANLVSNAAQHSPEGSTVQVTVVGRKDAVALSTDNPVDAMPLGTLDALFDPLRRIANDSGDDGGNAAGHLGLGLFIVREIARAHGGTVDASIADGRIRFCMVLPKADPVR